MVALLLIATGAAYWRYAEQMISSAAKFFVPHDVILFTDRAAPFAGVKRQVSVPHYGFPQASLLRYHAMLGERELLAQYAHLFHADADMRFVAPVSADEVCAEGLTATEHPGFIGNGGTPERNSRSAACCPQVRQYFCGGFSGGASAAFLAMAEAIRAGIDHDSRRGVLAVWHDESHLNKYLFHHPPAKILSPAFCYPDQQWRIDNYRAAWTRARGSGYFESVKPKLLAIEKGTRSP